MEFSPNEEYLIKYAINYEGLSVSSKVFDINTKQKILSIDLGDKFKFTNNGKYAYMCYLDEYDLTEKFAKVWDIQNNFKEVYNLDFSTYEHAREIFKIDCDYDNQNKEIIFTFKDSTNSIQTVEYSVN